MNTGEESYKFAALYNELEYELEINSYLSQLCNEHDNTSHIRRH